MMRWALATLWVVISPVAYCANSGSSGFGLHLPSLSFFKDSDDFEVQRVGIGLYPLYSGIDRYSGLKFEKVYYARNAWSADASQLSFVQHQLDANGLGHSISVGVHSLASRDLVVLDTNFSAKIGDGLRSEVFLVRDRVETQQSLTDGVYFNFFGASLEQQITDRFVAIGMLAQQRFSDDNVRDHQRVRVVYDLYPDLGVNTQFRYRQYQNSGSSSVNYFNPDRYAETLIALGARGRISEWSLSGLIGFGRQRVSSDPSLATYLYEFDAKRRFGANDWFRFRVSQARSDGFGSPSYTYQLVELGWLIGFEGAHQ